MSSADVMDQTSPRYDQQQQPHSSTTAATATTQTSSAEPGAVLQPGPASSVIIGGKFVINHNEPIWRRFYKILILETLKIAFNLDTILRYGPTLRIDRYI